MKEIKESGLKIKVYDSIDELPIKRFHKYNKFMLIDGGVGSDINDANNHIVKAMRFVSAGDKKNATIELENMRQLMYLMAEEISPKHLAFATLVAEVNGIPQNDISDDALSRLHHRFGNIKVKRFGALIESLKKKIDEDLSVYFKDNFSDSGIKEYYDHLKQRVLLQIRQIKQGVDLSDEIRVIDDKLLLFFKPSPFSGDNSAEIDHDKNFENMCIVLTQKLNIQPKEMTVLEFYNAFEYLKKSLKEEQKQNKRNRPKKR